MLNDITWYQLYVIPYLSIGHSDHWGCGRLECPTWSKIYVCIGLIYIRYTNLVLPLFKKLKNAVTASVLMTYYFTYFIYCVLFQSFLKYWSYLTVYKTQSFILYTDIYNIFIIYTNTQYNCNEPIIYPHIDISI